MAKVNKHPGVFIEEQSSFPNSIAAVETAIPAFVGYDGFKSPANVSIGSVIKPSVNISSSGQEDFWRQGGLAGAKLEDAFGVRVGLGTTMTAVDIAEGLMIVSIAIAVVRPAEFIVFTIDQKMQTA